MEIGVDYVIRAGKTQFIYMEIGVDFTKEKHNSYIWKRSEVLRSKFTFIYMEKE